MFYGDNRVSGGEFGNAEHTNNHTMVVQIMTYEIYEQAQLGHKENTAEKETNLTEQKVSKITTTIGDSYRICLGVSLHITGTWVIPSYA